MNTEEIRKLLEEGKLVIGHNEAKKALETGSAVRIAVAENAPATEADAMRDYAVMAGAEVVELSVRNDQLGTICRKPFAISFFAVTK